MVSSLNPRLGTACANVIAGGNLNVNLYACKRTPARQTFPPRKVRRRAYELYVQRGSQAGSGAELDDRLCVEAEILRAQDAASNEASEDLFQ